MKFIKNFQATVAENPEEVYWIKLKEQSEKQIESLKHEIIINQAVLDLAEKKIKGEQKNGK